MSTQTSNNGVALIGRILLALIFILAGFSKIGGFAGTAGYIASKGLPMASVLAALTIVVEVGGGLALLTGFYARWAALALAAFSVLTALIFHNFWAVPADQAMNQNIHFMKNLAIAGGMLMVFSFGPGSLSVGSKRAA